MADLTDILYKQILQSPENNHYSQSGAALANAQFDTSELKPMESILTSLVQGLGGGALQGLGQRQTNRNNQQIMQGLSRVMNAEDPAQAAMKDPALQGIAPLLLGQQLKSRIKDDELRTKYATQTELAPGLVTAKTDAKHASNLVNAPLTASAVADAKLEKKLAYQDRFDAKAISKTRLSERARQDERIAGSERMSQIERKNAVTDAKGVEVWSKVMRKEPLTEEDSQYLAADMSRIKEYRQQTSAQGVQKRFEKTFDRSSGERIVPGYEKIDPDLEITPAAAQKLRTKVGTINKTVSKLKQLKASGDRAGFMKVYGDEAALQGALHSALVNAQRNITESGANMTEEEVKLIKDVLPAVAAGSTGDAIKRKMLGRDQSKFTDAMIKLVESDLKVEFEAQGLRKKGSKPSGQTKSIGGAQYRKGAQGWELVE